MENTSLPTIRQAPRENIALLQRGDTAQAEALPTSAQRTFLRKQACVQELGVLRVVPEIGEKAQSSWTDLTERTTAWTDGHIQNLDFTRYAQLSGEFPYQTVSEAKRVAREGVITIGAFLEVIARVAMREDFDDPNDSIANVARRSQAFILAWAGVHSEVDVRLAYALSVTPKPHKLTSTLRPGLRFDPKWFTLVESAQQVILDSNKAQNLRDETERRHPSGVDNNKEPLFGCPGRQWIPRIFTAMATSAEKGNLFELSYLDERQNHGYEIEPTPCARELIGV